MLYLDGFSDPMEVIERSAIPDGEIYPVDSMNVDLITNTSEIDGRPRIMTQLESIVCSPKTKKHNYETTIGLKVYDPYRTGALKFDITAK